MRLVPSLVLLWILSLLALAGPVAAQSLPAQVVVEGDGATATVQTAPFRLSVQDASGRTVLEQVPNQRAQPFVTPPGPDPQPGGGDVADRPTLYAPLTFTVGVERSVV